MQPEYTQIPLCNHDAPALVDVADAELLVGYRWHVDSSGHVHGYREHVNGQPKWVSMSRLIMCATNRRTLVDHRNRIPLDNRRRNLRLVTDAQNAQNSIAHADNKSGYKGVSPDRARWRATIFHEGRNMRLGVADTPEEAARLYDVAARLLRGEYARLNFPRKGEQSARRPVSNP